MKAMNSSSGRFRSSTPNSRTRNPAGSKLWPVIRRRPSTAALAQSRYSKNCFTSWDFAAESTRRQVTAPTTV